MEQLRFVFSVTDEFDEDILDGILEDLPQYVNSEAQFQNLTGTYLNNFFKQISFEYTLFSQQTQTHTIKRQNHTRKQSSEQTIFSIVAAVFFKHFMKTKLPFSKTRTLFRKSSRTSKNNASS